MLRAKMVHAVEQLNIPSAATRARLSAATKTRSSRKLEKRVFKFQRKKTEKALNYPHRD